MDGLTLRVPRGAVYGLLGANGAGKTTTIKTLLGFRASTRGSARIGYVSETNSLYLGMTIPQFCAFFQATTRRWDQATVDRILALFSLRTTARVRTFSKGMRTQLALSLALGGEPDLLILDEPTTGLEPIARRAFLDVLVREVAAAGKMVFFSSHILPDVEAVADSVGILRAGRLLVRDELDALKERHALVRLGYAEPLSEEALMALRRFSGVIQVEREGRSARVRIHGDVAAAVAALRAVATPATMDITHLSLDDIFLFYAQQTQIHETQAQEVHA